MDTRTPLGCLLVAVSLFFGCDKHGVYPLGLAKDVVVACGAEASSWLRSVDGATEGVVLGVRDPATLDQALAEDGVCFHVFRVEHDSTTNMKSGILTRAGSGYQAIIAHEYSFAYRPDEKLLKRDGAERKDLEPLLVVPVDVAADGAQLLVDFEGTSMRLTGVSEILGRLDPSATTLDAPGGPKDIYRMFALTLFTSLVRLPGFGSTGMVTYAKEPGAFLALLSGGYDVGIDSIANPTTRIEYSDFQDLDGIVVNGLQITAVDFSGNGPMEGVLDAAFHLDPAEVGTGAAPFIDADIDYGNIEVRDGVAAGGYYVVSYGGASYEIDYTISVEEDLTAILPISEGLP